MRTSVICLMLLALALSFWCWHLSFRTHSERTEGKQEVQLISRVSTKQILHITQSQSNVFLNNSTQSPSVVTTVVENSTAPAGKVILQVILPTAVFLGTPKNLKTPFLEPSHPSRSRPVFYVPEEVTNVALKKKVTSSDSEPVIGELAMVTDGDKEGTDGSYVELGPGKQWVQIDLGQQYAIYAVVVWHFHGEPRIYRGVVVQVSDDPDFIQNVQTIFNNDQDNSLGLGKGKDYEYIETYEGRLIDARGVEGRYVRLYSKGNTSNEMNHYTEVEVYGKMP